MKAFTESGIAKNLGKVGVQKGYCVSIWDGEDYLLKNSTDPKTIAQNVHQVDEEYLIFSKPNGENIGSIFLVYGNSPEELIADYTDNPLIEELIKAVSPTEF